MPPVKGAVSLGKGPSKKKTNTGGAAAPSWLSTLMSALGSTNTSQIDTNALAAQASLMAAGDVSGQINAYRREQDRLNQQAADRAKLVNAAALAASKFTTGIGDATTRAFQDAADREVGYAQGFSGDLQNTATGAAQNVADALRGAGAPGAPIDNGASLSRLLYGLGGALPANTLLNTGTALGAAQRDIPASILGYGNQQAAGLLGAGLQAAEQYIPKISDVIASTPSVTNKYLTSLTDQAVGVGKLNQAAQANAVNTAFKSISANQADQRLSQTDQRITDAEINAVADRNLKIKTTNAANAIKVKGLNAEIAYHNTLAQQHADDQAALAAYRSDQITLGQARIKLAQKTLNNKLAPIFNANNSRALGVRTDQYGHMFTDKKGNPILMPNFKWGKNGIPVKMSSPGKASHLTAYQKVKFNQQATSAAKSAHDGYTVVKAYPLERVAETDPKDGKPWSEPVLSGSTVVAYNTHYPPLNYEDAMGHATTPFEVKAVDNAYAAENKQLAAALNTGEAGGQAADILRFLFGSTTSKAPAKLSAKDVWPAITGGLLTTKMLLKLRSRFPNAAEFNAALRFAQSKAG